MRVGKGGKGGRGGLDENRGAISMSSYQVFDGRERAERRLQRYEEL